MRMGKKTPNRILDLLKKDLLSSLSKDEQKDLDNWLSQSPENQKLYQEIRNGKAAEVYKKGRRMFNLETGWSNVFKAIYRNKQQFVKSKPRYLYLKIAAVFVVLIIASFFGKKFYENYQQSQYESFVNHIEPVEGKATLVLGKNKKITIQQNHTDTLLHNNKSTIRINQNQINYYTASQKKPKAISYNTLKVPRGGFFKLVLSDSTIVWVNAESELRFPEVFSKKTRKVYLTGEAFFDVSSNGKPFVVQFGNKTVEVLGTEFNIESRKNASNDFVTLAEGLVKVTTPFGNVKLHPDHQVIINNKNKELTLKKVNHLLYTGWVHGKIIYKNAPLSRIVEDLERRYNVQIDFKDKSLQHIKFSLFFNRQDQVSQIFEILKATGQIDFELSNHKIIITKK